jgi:hypothetical protein
MALDKEIFKENGIQFVGRYVYDSGEVSAIGPISKVIEAKEYIVNNAHLNSPAKYRITVGSSHPTYAKYLDIYARVGNEGVFRRCATLDVSKQTFFTFSGELFEALPSEESTKLFDTIPLETKTIEVANNRVFLANNKDDFDNDPHNMFIQIDDSDTQLTGSIQTDNPQSYLNYSDLSYARVSGYGIKAFTNASQYKIGIAFYDEYLRTRGVEVYKDFETGNFDYPINPKVTLKRMGDTPSWAKYYQVVMTKNLTKDFSYEGYASHYFWKIKNGTEEDMRYIRDTYRGDILYLVLDISGMIQSGFTYTYQAGDRINLNLSSTSSSKVIRNMKVVGQSDNFIYVEWTAGESFETSAYGVTYDTRNSLNAGDDVEVWRMFFEIYSPRSLEDTQIFYETGELRSIDTDFPSLNQPVVFDINSNPIEGDMTFINVAMRTYSINSTHSDDHILAQNLEHNVKVLIRKVNGTTRNSNWDRNLGKVLVEYDNQSRNRNESKIKYGGKYIQGTNINPISSFSFVQEAEVPYENGAITSLKRASKVESDGDIMLAICERETASLYIGEAVLSGTTGDGFVSSIQSVIGTVRNLKGGFGSSHRRSIVQYAGNIYFWDNNKKKVMRYGADGLTPISDYFMKSYFLDKSGDCLGFYDPYYDTYHIQFDSDTKSVGFHEGRNRWISFYDITSQAAETREENMLLFKTSGSNVEYYESLQSDYTEFFGTEKDADITYVMNTQLPEVLKNIKIYTNMDIYDYNNANDVKSELIRVDIDNENGQSTELVEANYFAEERVLYSHILRDSGSTGGLVSGDHVTGSITDVKLTLRNNDIQTRLNNVIIETDLSSGHLS